MDDKKPIAVKSAKKEKLSYSEYCTQAKINHLNTKEKMHRYLTYKR